MSNTGFTNLSPVTFLQTFVFELMHLCVEAGIAPEEQLIEKIARSASRFFEDAYREEFAVAGTLDLEGYTDLIIGLKNKIGGHFSPLSIDDNCIRVVSKSCPFGEGVKNAPDLCRMTSSVFGGIAARNFGYAKVELNKRIALGDSGCDVYIHLNKEEAKTLPGIEYMAPLTISDNLESINDLHSRIEEQMHRIWCQINSSHRNDHAVKRPTIIARSPAMQSVLRAIEVISPTPAAVLIQGETGVGKELVARAIHAMSERCEKPFIAVNCGAIPESIVESVLFGHEKGAFTGATEIHQGYFERADGGTLFLDEIDTLTPAIQTRLLRVIQEGELERVGGHRNLLIDVRIISATNCDLEQAVAQGHFRKDLYYRINVVKLSIPPLSKRLEDLPYLVDLILKRLSKRYNKPIKTVHPKVLGKLRAYHWPGNVRELENTLEKAVLFTKGSEISEILISQNSVMPVELTWKELRKQMLEQLEQTYLEHELQRTKGNVNAVAEAMEMTARAVYQKLKVYGINPAVFKS
jgi:DNA-binding NtrC family response regulator